MLLKHESGHKNEEETLSLNSYKQLPLKSAKQKVHQTCTIKLLEQTIKLIIFPILEAA